MEKKIDKRLELRKFGFSFSLGMLILLLIGFLKHFNLIFNTIIAIIFLETFLFAIIKPEFLKFQYTLISAILKTLGLVITNFTLIIFYYFIFTPIAVLLRIFNKDEIKKISSTPEWKEISPEENNPEKIEKLY
ncbi:MAG: hypothetical protein N2258_06320 [Brevinematales bacterium]|nr:hypothetical protein [Brevinematales bacterium]